MSVYRTRYFVTYPGVSEQEVDLDGWRKAERAAGFTGPAGHAATGGFSGYGIEGRVTYGLDEAEPVKTPAMSEHENELELEIDGSPEDVYDNLLDVVDLASDQGRISWVVTGDGKRVAAVVPVGVAEAHVADLARVLVSRPREEPAREGRFLFPGQVQLSPDQAPDGVPIDRKITPSGPLTVQVVQDALSLAGVMVSAETITEWSGDERLDAYDWAMHEHLHASDNPVARRTPRRRGRHDRLSRG